METRSYGLIKTSVPRGCFEPPENYFLFTPIFPLPLSAPTSRHIKTDYSKKNDVKKWNEFPQWIHNESCPGSFETSFPWIFPHSVRKNSKSCLFPGKCLLFLMVKNLNSRAGGGKWSARYRRTPRRSLVNGFKRTGAIAGIVSRRDSICPWYPRYRYGILSFDNTCNLSYCARVLRC